jgi:hypothetical protein
MRDFSSQRHRRQKGDSSNEGGPLSVLAPLLCNETSRKTGRSHETVAAMARVAEPMQNALGPDSAGETGDEKQAEGVGMVRAIGVKLGGSVSGSICSSPAM